jgi:hypothetical protein
MKRYRLGSNASRWIGSGWTAAMPALHNLWHISEDTFRLMLEARYRPPPRSAVQPQELYALMLGDGLVERSEVVLMRTVDISRSSDEVWPWLAQMMRGAGVYGWPDLETRCCQSSICLVHDLAPPQHGDRVGNVFSLARVVAGRELVWRSARHVRLLEYSVREFTLDYLLLPTAPCRTRLLVRLRGSCDGLTDQICRHLFDTIDFLLPAHQLPAIKRLAENHGRNPVGFVETASLNGQHQAATFLPAPPIP